MYKRSASDFTTAYHSYEQLHVKYFNINSAIVNIRLQFRLIYSPGQLFALCFTSENKITGLLLVTYKYRSEIIVKLKEKKKKKKEVLSFEDAMGSNLAGKSFSPVVVVGLFVFLSFHAHCIRPCLHGVGDPGLVG